MPLYYVRKSFAGRSFSKVLERRCPLDMRIPVSSGFTEDNANRILKEMIQ
jgi:hypothetical protein